MTVKNFIWQIYDCKFTQKKKDYKASFIVNLVYLIVLPWKLPSQDQAILCKRTFTHHIPVLKARMVPILKITYTWSWIQLMFLSFLRGRSLLLLLLGVIFILGFIRASRWFGCMMTLFLFANNRLFSSTNFEYKLQRFVWRLQRPWFVGPLYKTINIFEKITV